MDKRVLRERMRKKQQQIRRRQMMKKGAYVVAVILVLIFVIGGIMLPVAEIQRNHSRYRQRQTARLLTAVRTVRIQEIRVQKQTRRYASRSKARVI